MRICLTALLMATCMLSSPAFGQTVENDTETVTEDDAEILDEIIVRGTKQTDPAMSAFLAGDYETAEIEFDRNAFCALRVERNFVAGLEAARDSTLLPDAAAEANTAPQPTGGPGGGVSVPQAQANAPAQNFNSSDLRKDRDQTRRTCEDRGFQTYMKGLSQLKLGKMEEARDTFKSATKINRMLYDAHFRLSLMAYQDGDIGTAEKHMKRLKAIAKRCRRCSAKQEIEAQLAYLGNLLNG